MTTETPVGTVSLSFPPGAVSEPQVDVEAHRLVAGLDRAATFAVLGEIRAVD